MSLIIATFLPTANISAPWLLCNGTSGTPDLRGEFIRVKAAARTIGSLEGQKMATHGHTMSAYILSGSVGGGSGGPASKTNGAGGVSSSAGGSEVRPINYSVNYFMSNNTEVILGAIIPSLLTQAQMNTLSPDYALCNGGSIAGSPYAILTGDNNTIDLRNQFLRGFDAGRGIDTGRVIKTSQTSSFLAHTHTFTEDINISGGGPGGGIAWGNTNYAAVSSGVNSAQVDPSETRPINIAVNYFLKIK